MSGCGRIRGGIAAVAVAALVAACGGGESGSPLTTASPVTEPSVTAPPATGEPEAPATTEWGDLTPPRLDIDALVPLEPSTATGPACPGSAAGRIVFERRVFPPGVDDPQLAEWSIVVVDDQGQELAVLADNADPEVMTVRHPAWSPDGTRVVYYEPRFESGDQLVVVACDGSEEFRRTDVRQRTASYPVSIDAPYHPAWSPDGSLIAFAARGGLFLVGAELDTPIELRSNLRPGPYRPSWSADSSSVVVGLEASSASDLSLAVIGIDGSSGEVGAGERGRFQPAWSPDGMLLAFVERGDPAAIWVMEADGGNARRVTPPGAPDAFQPSWSPDGAEIVYVSGPVGDTHLRIIGIDGSGDRPLTPEGAFEAYPQWAR